MEKRINPRLMKAEYMCRCKLTECRAACCLHGVWIDRLEVQDIRAHAHLIAPFMEIENSDPGDWFDEREEPDENALSGWTVHSAVHPDEQHYGGTACVFLRKDYKCALQVAAETAGLHPWRFKPFYCILHPLDLDDEGRITLDDTDLMLAETGSCLRPAIERIPLLETFEPELRYLLGAKAYERLLNQVRSQDGEIN